MNRVRLVGYVGTDAKIVNTTYNDMMIFTMATNTPYTDRKSEVQSNTQWHRVHVLNPDMIEEHYEFVKSGANIEIEGELQYFKPDPAKYETTAYIAVNWQGVLKVS